MAETGATSRGGLEGAFDLLINDNTTNDITAVDVRDVLNSLKDSNLNLTDDDAKDLTYNPITLDNWEGTGPTSVGHAIDELANNNQTLSFYANTDDTVSNVIILDGEGLLIDNSEITGTNVSSVTYETSLDNSTWTLAPGGAETDGTFAALKVDVDAMGTSAILYIRAIIVFTSLYVGEDLVTLKYKKL